MNKISIELMLPTRHNLQNTEWVSECEIGKTAWYRVNIAGIEDAEINPGIVTLTQPSWRVLFADQTYEIIPVNMARNLSFAIA